MEKQIITFSANEQTLTKTGGVDCYASNTVAYIEARFDLGENWSGYDSVRAVWWNDYNKTVATVLDSAGTCIVPYEVLTRKGAVKVNLVGSIAENDVLTDRLTTCPVIALTIKCNAKTDGDNTQPITPSEYEQFVAEVKEDADRAEAGAESAETSAQSASESAIASANSATSSAQSATASAGSAQSAQNSAISAENAKGDAEDARDKILGMRATATTLEAGSDATASYSDGVLTLGIPRGDKGVKGDTGDTGATPNISIGTVSTLEPTEDATASITGTAEEPILNLGIPKGDTGEVSQAELDEAITDLKSDINLMLFKDEAENIFDGTFVEGEQVATSTGAFVAGSSWARTGYIPVKAGVVNIGLKNPTAPSSTFQHFALYDTNKAMKSTGTYVGQTVLHASDMYYIQLSVAQDGYLAFDILVRNVGYDFYVSQVATPTKYKAYYETIYQIKDSVLPNYLKDSFEDIFSVNRYNGEYTVGGYVIQTTGAVGSVSTHSYTPFIDISNHGGRDTVISNTRLANFGYANLRYAFYKEDKTFISGAIAPTLQYDSELNRDYAVLTTPANAKYIRFSAPNVGFTDVKDWQIQYETVSKYYPYTGDHDGITTEAIIDNPYIDVLTSTTVGIKPPQVKADTLSDGETLVVETNSVMKNQKISFFAKIGSAFDKVWVGHGTGSYGYYIIVDGTNFSYASNGAVGTTIPHGLTISEFIGVCIEVDVKLNVKLTITTAGGTYTKTQQINSSWRGDIFAKSDGSAFTDAVLTWESDDYKCPIWAFGDSYFTLYSPTRWPYYVAREWGYNNILLNAYPGENSSSAWIDFVNAIKHGTPKKVIWCLGMNDGDDGTSPDATWLWTIKNVKYVCEVKGIELIPATIPIVDSTENTYKNQWIRNNFDRYVDFATALADVDGWLSNDGIHPSEIGGRFMALQLLADVPELMQGK